MASLSKVWSSSVLVFQKEIWKPSHLNDRTPRGLLYAVLRVISITWTVFFETKLLARAAALSFSSLLGLGPMIAIAVLIGGFILGNNENSSTLIAHKLGELLQTVVPQLRQLEQLNATQNNPGELVAPGIVKLIEGIITGARSGSAAGLGVFSLILIVLLLFKSVEDAFNDIWGVRIGRSLLMRIVFYWTILTLGAVLFFAATASLGAGAFISVFNASLQTLPARGDPAEAAIPFISVFRAIQDLPGGENLLALLSWSVPLLSAAVIVLLLAIVYRIIPNTRVFWTSAFIGAIVVAALLVLNNFLALFYLRRVVLERSLYGSLALPIVLMLGLYTFWIFILIGAAISYAVQNVHFRNSQAAWGQLAESMRERLSLVVLLSIGRRFQECQPPITATELSNHLRVPTQILNECVNRLVAMNLICTLRPAPNSAATEFRYQPARPLNRISLLDFKTLDDNFGDDPVGQALERIDPVLHHYEDALGTVSNDALFQKTLEDLFKDYPFDGHSAKRGS